MMKKRYLVLGCIIGAASILAAAFAAAHLVVFPAVFGRSSTNQPPFPMHTVWAQSLNEDVLDLTPYEASNMVLAKTQHSLVGIDASNGRELWRAPVRGQVESHPAVVAAGRAFVTDQATVRAFDLATGVQVWQQPIRNQDSWVTAASDRIVLVNSVAEYVNAYESETGRLLWSAAVGRGPVPGYISNGAVYVVDDAIRALDPSNGRLVWQAEYAGTGPSVVSSEMVYFTVSQSVDGFDVVAFDLLHRSEIWRRSFPASGPQYLGLHGNVLFVLNNQHIWTLSADTGLVRWMQQLDGGSHPTVVGNEVYAIEDFQGVLQSMAMNDGQLTGVLRVSSPKLLYFYHDNLVRVGNRLVSAQGHSVTAYGEQLP